MMKVILPLVINFEATDWATKYGLAESEAAGDFASTVRRAVSEDGIRRALDTAWPKMSGHITLHTPDQLDPALRDELLDQLRDARDADLDQALLAEIRRHLAAHRDELDQREPRWVVFGTDEWDNGHFLTGNGASVYFPDGDLVEIYFDGTCVDELLTDAYGTRGRDAALGVDLMTGSMEFDDSLDNVLGQLGIPLRATTTGDRPD